MWKPPECTVSGGFFLLVGWFALCCGWQMALTVLGAAAWHEFGHLLALRLCGGEARRLRVGMLGAVIEVRGAMGYGQELASALAGPLANLLAAAVLGRMGCTTAAGANGVLCAFNLLPVRPLDGGRALYLLLAWLAGPGTAEWGCRWVGISRRWRRHPGRRGWCGARGEGFWLLPAVRDCCWPEWAGGMTGKRSYLSHFAV